MIEYKQGDLLKSDCNVIVHGCNCFHKMGGGIARQIKQIYPEAYNADLRTDYGDIKKMGDFSYVVTENKFTGNELYIINAYTQYNYGGDPYKIYADYDAIEHVMIKIQHFFVDSHDIQFKIGFPKIGSGLAGGDWNKISNIINNVFENRTVYVYEFNPHLL